MAEKQDDQVKKKKDLQKKYMEYQMLEQQIKQIQQQMEKLETQEKEAVVVEQSIADIAAAKTGTEILVPISGGVFFRADVKDSNRFLVNVGGGVVVEKDIDSAKELIHSQVTEISKYKTHLAEQLAEQVMQYQLIEQELHKLVED